MVRTVQPARDQSLLAVVRRLDPGAWQPGVVILLTYGPDRDWLKNLKASGDARMQRYGKIIGVDDARVVSRAEAARHVTKGWRPIIARVPFEQAVLLKKTDRP